MNRILIGVLLISTITPSYAAFPHEEKLINLKKSFTNNINDFVKCIKGDQDCDPKKKNIYRAGLAIITTIGLAVAIGGGVAYVMKRRNMKQNTDTSEITTEELSPLNQQFIKAAAKPNAKFELESLLNQGADINTQDANGLTPLIYVIIPKKDAKIDLSLIQSLINHGADVNMPDKNGATPLMYAVTIVDRNSPTTTIIKTLLHAGARVNDTDHNGWTALDWLDHTENKVTGKETPDQKTIRNILKIHKAQSGSRSIQ